MRVQAYRSCIAAVICIIASASATRAQEINYGTLQQLFGEPVTTSATGSPQQANQVPANMQIVSADQIRQSGASNIPDILRFIAGIDVRSYGVLDNEVSVRGYSQPLNPRLLVLINGRQVYDDDYGSVPWQALPVQLADIRQIEIVRGPASALFGFNAASGVVNIITFDPLFDRTNVINFGFGTDGTYEGSLVSTFNVPGKGGVTVQLGGLKTDEYSTRSLAGVRDSSHPHTDLGNYAIDGRYKPSLSTEVTLEVTQSQSDGLEQTPGIVYFRALYRNESIKSSFAVDSAIGIVTLLGYINQEKNALKSTEEGSAGFANQVGVLQLNDLLQLSNNQVARAGLEYRNNYEYGSSVVGDLRYSDYAASLMWSWQIVPALAFTAAGRIDHLTLGDAGEVSPASRFDAADFGRARITTPTYNLGLVWQPTTSDTFRLLTGRAVQTPSLIELGVQVQAMVPHVGTLLDAGNPFLKPSVSTNYELDYDRQLAAIGSVLRSAVFYSTTQDISTSAFNLPFVYDNGVLRSTSANIGSSESFGGEIGLQSGNTVGYRYNLSYSLVAVRDHLAYGPPISALGFVSATPTSIIDFGIGYSWERWETDVSGHWQSSYTDFQQAGIGAPYQWVNIPNYITMSGRIGYAVNPHLTLAVAGQQLTGAQIVETAQIEPERRLLFSATLRY